MGNNEVKVIARLQKAKDGIHTTNVVASAGNAHFRFLAIAALKSPSFPFCLLPP